MFAYLYFASVLGIIAFTRASGENEADRSTYISLVNLLKKNNEQLTQLIDLRRNASNASNANRGVETSHNDSADGLSHGKDSPDVLPANGEIFEGDLIMTPCLRNVVYGNDSNRCAGVIANNTWEWDGEVQGIRVPFTIAKNFTFQKTLIKALKEYNKRTCIRFTPRRVEPEQNGNDDKKEEEKKKDENKETKKEGDKYDGNVTKNGNREINNENKTEEIDTIKFMTNALVRLEKKLSEKERDEKKEKQVELDTDFIHFANGPGCSSMLGRIGGMQPLFLHKKCATGVRGVISTLHEMMHVLGMLHEQSRPDRDKYVKVLMKNIIDKHEHNFLKYEASDVRRNHPYNFNSIMHYHNNAFGKKDDEEGTMETLIARSDRHMRFGQRAMWSQGDVLSVNQFYCMGRQVHTDYSRQNHTNYKGLIADAIIKPTLSCEDCKAAGAAETEECQDCNDGTTPSFPELDQLDSIREANQAVI